MLPSHFTGAQTPEAIAVQAFVEALCKVLDDIRWQTEVGGLPPGLAADKTPY
jgi:hypothetical protein